MTDIDWHALAADTSYSIRNLIDGELSTPGGGTDITKHSARDGRLLYSFGEGRVEEVDQAVASAKAAYEDGRWADLSLGQRQSVLLKLADLIEENRQELALNECLDVGKPITNALGDVDTTAATFRDAANSAALLLHPSGSDGRSFCYHQRGPIGVVAGIAGWNFPVVLAAQKVAPALIMGNSIVLKPSEFTSLSSYRLAELALEAGVPPGVFNVVHGSGSIVGDRLARHLDVDMLSFVGSSATGKKLMVAAGQSNMKRLLLECGGKSPYLVFDDCPDDLAFMAADIVETAFPNQGALCVAGTRLLIQESMRDKLMDKIVAETKRLQPADPLNVDTSFGALINQGHLEKVQGYLQSGLDQGATLLCGGERVLQETGGYYFTPAVLDGVGPDFRVAKEEIFGPVLSVLTFKDEAEAIKLANDSTFGLASYLASTDVGRIHRLGKKIQSGSMAVFSTNRLEGGNVPLYSEAHKESGFGRRGGQEGLLAYSSGTTMYLFHD